MILPFRELPFGARQQGAWAYIPSEQCTERFSRLHRVRPIPRILSAGKFPE